MNKTNFLAIRALVKAVMLSEREWSVQGFGMLRTYLDLDKVWRLNVWSDALRVPGVSTIHDHPWDFSSWVISGKFTNMRFMEIVTGTDDPLYDWMTIRTGEGGGPDGTRGTSRLRVMAPEVYEPGDTYSQLASEIHESLYENLTVTLNKRTRRGDGEHARVFWSSGKSWTDAEPRAATSDEMTMVHEAARHV